MHAEQEVSRHSGAADVVALAATPAASGPGIRRIAVQSLGRSAASVGSSGAVASEPPSAAHDTGAADHQGGPPQGADRAAGVVWALHALKRAARCSRCAVVVTVAAGAPPALSASSAPETWLP
jgi:hypothetical protein